MKRIAFTLAAFAALLLFSSIPANARGEEIKLLNVSYDPTRELYEEINPAFAADYKAKTGNTVTIEQSHGGSSKQARAVIDGLKADVVTLALGWDIHALEKTGLVAPNWQSRLPDNASPYTSTVVFLVRKGNPKQIKDWPDLVKKDVQVIVANPKTSGGARWAFLAAWGFGGGQPGGGQARSDAKAFDDAKAREFVAALYKNVPVLDTGARGSTVTFAQKGLGDVLLGWENEAWLAQEEFGKEKFEIIYPSVSVLAEPPVAVVDKTVDQRSPAVRAAAEAYLKFLYTPAAQDIIAANHYRPRNSESLARHAAELPKINLFTVADLAGDWQKAQQRFFADGGVFDEIYKK